ncbi:YhgE/Pip family protein [Streptomyces tubercidicus]|uniref:YhgE/Pip family protein n=2 Tax=Streptomyces tubercidicus TaxID=47759 RepID=UPI002E16FF00
MRSPRPAALELKRFGRGKLPRAALAALLLLPLLYGALYLWSFWDPYGSLDKIPVALVNEDTGAAVDGKRVSAGDSIVSGLRDSHTFDWRPVDAKEAARGVKDGSYYLSLSIPADFSRRIASSSGDRPETGALKVRTNDANNYIVGQISRTVFSEVRSAASTKSSRTFLDKIFVSFSTLHGKTEQAADGADRLQDGIGQAKHGTGRPADGLGAAKNGSGKLVTGLGDLDAGAGRLSRGGSDLARGAGSAAHGSRQLADGSGQVAQGTQQPADKVNGVVGKVGPFIRAHGKEIGEAARLVADGSQAIRDHLDKLPAAASTGSKLSRGISDHLAAYYRTRCEGAVRLDTSCAELKQLTVEAATTADKAEEVSGYVHDRKNLDQLGRDLDTLHSHHGRRPRARMAGRCGAAGVHRGGTRADVPDGARPPGGADEGSASGAEPVSGHPSGGGTIAPMDSSNTRRDATRRKLFEAAVTLIAEQGFSSTTVDEIAERAGVAKGTVYYNFASKNVLFEELLRHGIEMLATSLQAAAEEVADRGGSRIDALDAMIRAGLDFISRYPALTQLYVAELWRTNRAWQSTLMVVRERAITVVEDVLREAVAREELSEEIDIPLTASALFGMVLVAALDWQSYQPDRSIDEVHAALSRLLQGRISGRPAQ